jgi:biotin-dependent carboxylase-like uncharacterized protein
VANTLVGNNQHAAVIEVAIGPFEIKVDAPVMIALCGHGFKVSITPSGQQATIIYTNRSLLLPAGATLLVKNTARSGRLYIAVAGGFSIKPVFGSTSTDLYGGFGGYRGRCLQQGDMLPCAPPARLNNKAYQLRLAAPTFRIRALIGADYSMLSQASQQQFWQAQWQIDSNSNRMAARLQAKPLLFDHAANTNLLSHAVLPGVVQLPPSGLPMVLLADAQTTGGYPRIAAVIEADLWQFAQMPTGSHFSFIHCNQHEALKALRQRRHQLERLKLGLKNNH